MLRTCQACRGDVRALLDAGDHPVANRFRTSPSLADEQRFRLTLGQCRACGLVQLTTLAPHHALAPTFDWITYNEPEGHLDAVADDVMRLPGLAPASILGAVTYKDDSTLLRLRNRGFATTWRVDPVVDLGVTVGSGLETIQAVLPEQVDSLRSRYPAADLLMVRHILEHAHDTQRFASALRKLVKPGGYLVFEVPDCSQVLATFDYTMLWEEHVLYFTPATYRSTLECLGFETVSVVSHPYPYENSLVAIVRATAGTPGAARSGDESTLAELMRGRRFAEAYHQRRQVVVDTLAERHRAGEKIAVFGAGHLSTMFINVHDIAQYLEFVVDDHPAKRGLFMPGSSLPIRESSALLTEGIDLCLSSLSPESETRVVARQAEFIARGGEFASIFPSSPRALRVTGQRMRSC